jgi:hypothetical protein
MVAPKQSKRTSYNKQNPVQTVDAKIFHYLVPQLTFLNTEYSTTTWAYGQEAKMGWVVILQILPKHF